MGQMESDPDMARTGWRMVIVAFFVLALIYSIWYSFAVFLVALTQELGWGRGETAFGFSLFTLSGAAFSPLIGSLFDRFGVRAVMVGGAVVTAAGLAACSQIQTLWQFYLWFGVVVALGASACGWMPCVAVIQSWFGRNFSTANGLANSGVGVGIFLLVPGIQLLSSSVGWRTAYLIMAAAALGLVAPLCLLLYRRPVAAVPAVQLDAAERPVQVSWTFGQALRGRTLWLLVAMSALLNFANQQPLVHQIAYLVDNGIDKVLAATVAGTIGLVSVFGMVVMGTFGGSALGAWLAGYLFDQTNSYLVPFVLAAIGSALAIAFAWLAAPRRARAAAARSAAGQLPETAPSGAGRAVAES